VNWEDILPEDVELVGIQPPGRANRLNEPLPTSIEAMAEDLVQVIPQWLDRPYIIYGHSLGSALAFELLHALNARRLPLPMRFHCGARRAPHLPPRIAPIHDYPAEQFKVELKSLNGTPEVVLNNADLMEIFIPILRSDFKAGYIYHRPPSVKLDCPVSVFGGALDDKVLAEDMIGWQEHFSENVTFRTFDGGHFFNDDNRDLVVSEICRSVPLKEPMSLGRKANLMDSMSLP
jgi:surfactin synthase thioesterase subunit